MALNINDDGSRVQIVSVPETVIYVVVSVLGICMGVRYLAFEVGGGGGPLLVLEAFTLILFLEFLISFLTGSKKLKFY